MVKNDFLELEQVCEMLGKTAEQIGTLVDDGILTPVWDGDKAYYRKGEVEAILAKEGSSIVDLAAEDVAPAGSGKGESFASALSDLAEASSGLDLLDASPMAEEAAQATAPAELNLEEIPLDLPATPKTPPTVGKAEPIVLQPTVPDLGLSGSSIISLDPSLEEAKTEEKKPAAAGKKAGINVFDDEEAGIETDPMGETQIAATVPELEAVGSGSGLLDLTRESDDTSLGPELLDVISPSAQAEETETETEAVLATPAEDSGQQEAVAAAEETPYEAPAMAAQTRVVSTSAPGMVPLNVCALIGVLALALISLATAAQIQDVWPAFLDPIAKKEPHYITFGVLILGAAVAGIVGIMKGRR